MKCVVLPWPLSLWVCLLALIDQTTSIYKYNTLLYVVTPPLLCSRSFGTSIHTSDINLPLLYTAPTFVNSTQKCKGFI